MILIVKESCNLTEPETQLATPNQSGSLRSYLPLMIDSMVNTKISIDSVQEINDQRVLQST